MTVNATIHFDFGSPNTYMSHKLIPGIEQRCGIKFDYFPVLLGGIFKLTGNQAPFVTYQNVKNKPAYQMLEMQRFIRDHNLTDFKMNKYFPLNTVQIMRGAIVARQEGFLPDYVDAVLKDMWEKTLKMDDPEVIAQSLTEHGFKADHIMKRIQDADIKEELLKNTEQSVEMGVFGCPSVFVGSELFFGKDRMGAVEEEIKRQQQG